MSSVSWHGHTIIADSSKPKEPKKVRAFIEVIIEYPADMPEQNMIDYSGTVFGWIENYAKAQAQREEEQHKR